MEAKDKGNPETIAVNGAAAPPGRRVLAVASAGGHWVQLQRLAPALLAHDVAFVTTDAGYRAEMRSARVHVVNGFSKELRIARLEALYRGILAAKGR
jgi:hypothetical protein